MKGRERCHHASVFPPELRDEIFLHELGNVLNGLQGAAERLRCASPDPEFDRWLRAIEHSSRQITRLADAFLGDASRRQASPKASDSHDGIELIEQLKALYPEVKVLVSSMHDEKTYAVRAFYRRNVHSPMFFPGKEGYLLFADRNSNEPQIVGEPGARAGGR